MSPRVHENMKRFQEKELGLFYHNKNKIRFPFALLAIADFYANKANTKYKNGKIKYAQITQKV